MTETEVVRLRDYFERLLNEQERRVVIQLEAIERTWQIRWVAQQEALKLQANEYERRLEILNHENARVAAVSDKSVSLERFEGYVEQVASHFASAEQRFRDYVASTNKELTLREGATRGISTIWAGVVGVIASVGIIVTLVLSAKGR